MVTLKPTSTGCGHLAAAEVLNAPWSAYAMHHSHQWPGLCRPSREDESRFEPDRGQLFYNLRRSGAARSGAKARLSSAPPYSANWRSGAVAQKVEPGQTVVVGSSPTRPRSAINIYTLLDTPQGPGGVIAVLSQQLVCSLITGSNPSVATGGFGNDGPKGEDFWLTRTVLREAFFYSGVGRRAIGSAPKMPFRVVWTWAGEDDPLPLRYF